MPKRNSIAHKTAREGKRENQCKDKLASVMGSEVLKNLGTFKNLRCFLSLISCIWVGRETPVVPQTTVLAEKC